MWARGRCDISWRDLGFGLLRCAWPGDRSRLERRLEQLWSPAGDALACYSVRSAFELLLRGLELPAGSEVLFSALNVRGMLRVVEKLGLAPVPVDLDLEHLAPRLDCLERAYEERAGGIYGVKGSFLFTSLKSHPRFVALLRRMNLDRDDMH